MNKSKLNYAVDMGLLLAFSSLALSGLSLWPFRPIFFTRHGWRGVHRLAALFTLGMATVHILLHGRWIAKMTRMVFEGSHITSYGCIPEAPN
ncbi:DUF4405 domain-containing protein [Moorella sp. Hama-1]|uniref:DUF4405 domain-containing protein n=1 Tax=Moorella sp. Hama-1 TaxID=2138101 RepID=UPI000D652D10|nr:DUF4405 domain-containing protein [Moorella sp. Hama-1]